MEDYILPRTHEQTMRKGEAALKDDQTLWDAGINGKTVLTIDEWSE